MLRIGAHSLIEEDEIIRMRFSGEISLSDIQQVIARVDAVIARHGGFGVIAEMRDASPLSLEARRYAVRWENVRLGFGVAIVGANLVVRTLLSRAISIFRGDSLARLEFFKSESEAHEWLLQQRAEWNRRVTAKEIGQ